MNPLPAAAAAPASRVYRLLLLALAVASIVTLVQYIGCVHEGSCTIGGDFPVFHRAGELTAAGNAAAVYDIREAHTWFETRPGMPVNVRPFVNPPIALLLFYPLGWFGERTAFLLWVGAQAALLLAALSTGYARLRLNPRGNIAGLLLPVLPFALYTFMTGQSGMICAALFLLALAWRRDHPLLGALALACLSFKPQLGLLLPLLLLKERNWRMLAWSAVFVLLMAMLTVALWGPGIWLRYAEMLELYRRLLATAPPTCVIPSASSYMALRMLGAGGTAAAAAQICVSLSVLALLWRKLGNADEPRIILLMATATFLVSPYAFIYDTVILSYGVLVLLARCATGEAQAGERILLILLAFIPVVALKIQLLHIPYTFAAISAAFLYVRQPSQAR